MPNSEELKARAAEVRRKKRRDANGDNLTTLEKSILNFVLEHKAAVSVKEIAVEMFGSDVTAEAKEKGRGEQSVRTIRNALRIPRAMGLLVSGDKKGTYVASPVFKKQGFKAAEKIALEWKEKRSKPRTRKPKADKEATQEA